MHSIAVIPARGGSKGIPKKNIKKLNGIPLIVYTIKAALDSKSLDKIVVSTDCDEIANVCRGYDGVEISMRPSELSTDTSKTEDALIYTYNEIKEKYSEDIHNIITLEPTSPFRKPQTISKCVELLKNNEVDSVICVVESTSVYGKIKDGSFEYLFPNQPRRRQEREPLYKETGVVYGTRSSVLLEKKLVIGNKLAPVVVDEIESLDINNILDFKIAEAISKSEEK